MARGAAAKQTITEKIFGVFTGAFMNGKEIRIPMEENGELVEIKVTLTAAKENVGTYGGSVSDIDNTDFPEIKEDTTPQVEPTQEEKDNIAYLLDRLGI